MSQGKDTTIVSPCLIKFSFILRLTEEISAVSTPQYEDISEAEDSGTAVSVKIKQIGGDVVSVSSSSSVDTPVATVTSGSSQTDLVQVNSYEDISEPEEVQEVQEVQEVSEVPVPAYEDISDIDEDKADNKGPAKQADGMST